MVNAFTRTSSDIPFVSMAKSEAHNFARMLEVKAEHSKFGASIGSMVAGNNDRCKLFSVLDELTFMHLHRLYLASVSSAETGKPKTISADFLSKIWNIKNNIAIKVLEQ